MKKRFILIGLLLTSFGAFSMNIGVEPGVKQEIKEGVSITVSVKSGDTPVKGALVKVFSARMVIGAGTTDASGNAAITINSYGTQPVTIEVLHALYKKKTLEGIKLSNGNTYNVALVAKGASAEEINAESEEKIAEEKALIDEHTKTAEELAKEREEAAALAEEKKRLAEEQAQLAEQKKEEAAKLR